MHCGMNVCMYVYIYVYVAVYVYMYVCMYVCMAAAPRAVVLHDSPTFSLFFPLSLLSELNVCYTPVSYLAPI